MKEFPLILDKKTWITPNVLHLAFRSETPFSFVPGEFITFLLDHPEGVKRRSYSIASLYTDTIDIAISYQKGGVASEALLALEVGQAIKTAGPFGRLVLKPEERPKHYILIATGTGVAPYRAMLPQLETLFHNDPDFKVTLILGVAYVSELLYGEDFIAFAKKHDRFTFKGFISREAIPEDNPYLHSGRLQKVFDTLTPSSEKDIVYLCGNPAMIDDIFAYLSELGFMPKQVRREKYISSN